MKIKKRLLETGFKALMATEHLTLKESRIRDAFLKDFTDLLQTFENDRKKIYEKFCTKDINGQPQIKDNTYSFGEADATVLIKEIEELLEEEVEIKSSPEIKKFLEETSYNPKFGEADLIDQLISLL